MPHVNGHAEVEAPSAGLPVQPRHTRTLESRLSQGLGPTDEILYAVWGEVAARWPQVRNLPYLRVDALRDLALNLTDDSLSAVGREARDMVTNIGPEGPTILSTFVAETERRAADVLPQNWGMALPPQPSRPK